jgi:hypothetical protein
MLDGQNTNVVELYSRLIKDEKQLTYYNSGIGTFVKGSWKSPAYWGQVINHTIDMAIAWYAAAFLTPLPVSPS